MAKQVATPEKSTAPALDQEPMKAPPSLDGGKGNAAAAASHVSPPPETSALLLEMESESASPYAVDTTKGTATYTDGGNSQSVTFNDGITYGTKTSPTQPSSDGAGSATSASSARSGGIAAKDGAIGLQGASSETVEVDGHTATTSASGSITNQGFSGKAGGELGQRARSDSGEVGVAGGPEVSGGCTGKVLVVDGKYVLRARVEASIGGSVGVDGKSSPALGGVTGALNAKGSVGAAIEVDHVFTAVELEKFPKIAAAAKSGKVLSEKEMMGLGPAAGLEAFIDAILRGGDPRSVADADAARQLPEGDAWTLEASTSHEVGGNLGGGDKSAGAAVSGKLTGSDKVRTTVKREGDFVVVTVAMNATKGSEAGVSATVEGVTGTTGTTSSQKADTSRTFRIKTSSADYGAQMSCLLAVSNPDDLRALDTDPLFEDVPRSGSDNRDETGTDSFGIGILGVTATAEFGEQHATSEASSERDGRRITGKAANTSTLKVGNGSVGGGVTDEASAHLTPDGAASLDVTSSTENSGIALSKPDGWAALESPGKAVTDALTTKRTAMQGLHLDDGDLEQLVLRAHDGAKWRACARQVLASADAGRDWDILREALVAPRESTDEELSEAQLRALTLFVSKHGSDATALLQAVSRHWEDVGGKGPDLGYVDEFPAELAEERTAFDDVLAGVADLTGMQDLPIEVLDKELGEVQRLQRVITAAKLNHPSVKASMLDRLSEAEQTMQALRVEAYGSPFGSDLDLKRQIDRLKTFQRQETELFTRCQHEMGEGQSTWEFLTADTNAPAFTLREIYELHELWGKRADELRSTYRSRGAPEATWSVSPVATEFPMRRLDPDTSTAVQLAVQFETYRLGA